MNKLELSQGLQRHKMPSMGHRTAYWGTHRRAQQLIKPVGASNEQKMLFEPIFSAHRLSIACTIDPCWKNDPATYSGALYCLNKFSPLLYVVKKQHNFLSQPDRCCHRNFFVEKGFKPLT